MSSPPQRPAFANPPQRNTHTRTPAKLASRPRKMSLEDLQERFKDLQDATAHVRELISRIGALEFPPGSPPLRADEEDSVLAELGSEVIQTLREGEDEVEALREEVDDLFGGAGDESEDGTRRLRDDISRFQKELSK